MKEKLSALEAVLFAMGDAVPVKTLAKALEISVGETEELLTELKEALEKPERGICLVRLEDAYQLATKPIGYEPLIRIARAPKKYALTDVQLETLSIIAYKQPVTKIEIEDIRGVKCDYAVNKLVEYGLVKEMGHLDAPGKPLLFGTTEEFLRRFGVPSLENLPGATEEVVAEMKNEAENEVNVKFNL